MLPSLCCLSSWCIVRYLYVVGWVLQTGVWSYMGILYHYHPRVSLLGFGLYVNYYNKNVPYIIWDCFVHFYSCSGSLSNPQVQRVNVSTEKFIIDKQKFQNTITYWHICSTQIICICLPTIKRKKGFLKICSQHIHNLIFAHA